MGLDPRAPVAQAAIERFIAQLEADGRDPDKYESDCVESAITAYDFGNFSISIDHMQKAVMVPQPPRAIAHRIRTRQQLRDLWTAAQVR